MNIRKASKDDISSIAQVIRISYSTVAKRFNLTFANCPKHPSNCTADWVESDFQRGVAYFVVEAEGQIIGCAALEKASADICYLERLAILPQNRNKGTGTSLVQQSISEARLLGVKKIGIGIIAKQEELRAWYKGFGFVETGRKTFEHLPFEVAFMELNVPPLHEPEAP